MISSKRRVQANKHDLVRYAVNAGFSEKEEWQDNIWCGREVDTANNRTGLTAYK